MTVICDLASCIYYYISRNQKLHTYATHKLRNILCIYCYHILPLLASSERLPSLSPARFLDGDIVLLLLEVEVVIP
jgi:hypothetical protein